MSGRETCEVSLDLDAALMDAARELGVDISQAVEAGIRQAILDAAQQTQVTPSPSSSTSRNG